MDSRKNVVLLFLSNGALYRLKSECLLTTKRSPSPANLAFLTASKSSFFSMTFWETRSPNDMTAPVIQKGWVAFQNFDITDGMADYKLVPKKHVALLSSKQHVVISWTSRSVRQLLTVALMNANSCLINLIPNYEQISDYERGIKKLEETNIES